MDKPDTITITIRGLERDLYRQSKSQAALRGITIAAWCNEAWREKLERERSEK